MTTPSSAHPNSSSRGCGPVAVVLISFFVLIVGLLTGAGGLYAYLSLTDSGLKQLGLADEVRAAPAPAPATAAATAEDEELYALVYPILDTLQVQGGLDTEIVQNRLNRDRFAFQKCYLTELNRSPQTRGEMSLQFTVSGSTGKVIAAVSRGNYTGSEALSRCVLEEIRSWSYPSPETSSVVVVRFDLLFLPFRSDGT